MKTQTNFIIENQELRIELDASSGRYSVRFRDGAPFVLNAIGLAEWREGRCTTAEPGLTRDVVKESIADELGQGQRLRLLGDDPRRGIRLQLDLCLYENRPGFAAELIVENQGSAPWWISQLQACRALLEDGAGLYPPAPQPYSVRDSWVLTNGYLYSESGRIELMGSNRWVQSCWNLAVINQVTNRAVAAGSVDHDQAETELLVSYDMRVQPITDRAGLSLIARSLYGPRVTLPPGRTLGSGALFVVSADTAQLALEEYARAHRDRNQIRPSPPQMGWCSWYLTGRKITEEEVLKNARFMSEHLKDYGMDLLQIDDGYQRGFGDWEANDRFPRGMAWLAGELHRLGLRAGLWIAPYVIAKDSAVAREHPEWLGRDQQGRIKDCRAGEDAGYALDLTHPAAREWLRALFQRIARDWGYDMVKLDFVEWSVLAIEQYHDPTCSRAAAYRRGLRTVREAVGPGTHILDGGPVTASGICNSWRVGRDFEDLTWRQYTEKLWSNAPSLARRYYLHNHFWSNDPDHLGLALLSLDQARSVASLLALSGGTLLNGDRLYELAEDKLAILKKILPVYARGLRTLDLLADFPSCFAVDVERPFENWQVVGLFNWDLATAQRKRLPLRALGLDPDAPWLAYEFWQQQWLPLDEGWLDVELPPGSCAVVAIRRALDRPQLIGTDRHVLQGAVEIEALQWDARRGCLAGTLNAIRSSSPALAIRVPAGYRPAEAAIDGRRVEPAPLCDGLMRLTVPSEKTGRQSWSLAFEMERVQRPA